MWLKELLKNNDFLNWAISICQIGIVLIPIAAKKTLINRQPKQFFKKSNIRRIRPGVYYMLLLSTLAVYFLNRKELNSKSDLSNVEQTNKDLTQAIKNSGYVYKSASKSLFDSLRRFKFPVIVQSGKYFNGKPRLTNKGVFPYWGDTTFKNNEIELGVSVCNVGLSRAENISVLCLLFTNNYNNLWPNYQKNSKYSIIDPGVGLTLFLPFKLNRKPNQSDTIYCITKYTYTDSIKRNEPAVYGYFKYLKSYGLSFRGMTGIDLLNAMDAKKRYKF